MAAIDIATSLDNLRLERDAIVLYDALASIERDPGRAAAFARIAGNERRHAEVWAAKLTELGAQVPAPGRARLRIRFIVWLARRFGTRAVADLVVALEGDEEALYEGQEASPEVQAIAADEREHARIWERLRTTDGVDGDAGGSSIALASARPAHADAIDAVDVAGRDGVSIARSATSAAEIVRQERWHRTGRSGTLRAVIFGVSDGLVSNLSLVMGVAGAATVDDRLILLAGIAGLLAGAFSMAAGEYISMQSQRELFERQIALERAEMEVMPEEEEAELAAAYRSKGFAPAQAARIADLIFADREAALDTLVREELGLDPAELGSPVGAAVGSFAAFALGAFVPVIPFLLLTGSTALVVSLVLSLAALFGVGAAVSLLTGRSLWYSGIRQLGIGLVASLVTYAIGALIGVATT